MTHTFSDLLIFEMANNHQGSVAHGLRIIEEAASMAREYQVRAAVKLQYRELDSFVHPAAKDRGDLPHIPRFMSTRLDWNAFAELSAAIREHGMSLVITAFDEPSVEMALNHGVDILKVASCSAMDWPLLGEIAKARKPVIASTGGCRLDDIDKIVTFYEHRDVKNLALLHCVGTYPTADKDQHLNFMRRMMERYPHCTIGYSGHEGPDNLSPARAATAMGARILERHFGVPTDEITLNAYSMNPAQARAWVQAVVETRELCGAADGTKPITEKEAASLQSLMRSVYARRAIRAGELLTRDAVFFAMPYNQGQTTTMEYMDSMIASRDYDTGDAICERRAYSPVHALRTVVHEAKSMLREAKIPLGSEYQIEISHHYGVENLRRTGAVIVDLFNREYCKKLIILLPGQTHPSHAHQAKEETFTILHGEMTLELAGETSVMRPGDKQLVRRGEQHSFRTDTGVIFEEISTTHIKGDSYYADERIARLDPMERKTIIERW